MLLKPVVLKILTTCAPADHCATCSPAEVVVPISRPERSGNSGLEASSSALSLRSSAVSTAFAAGHGRALTTTPPKAAASTGEPADACPPQRPSSSRISGALGSRTPNRIWCPRFAHAAPSVPPTFPPPKIPIFMLPPYPQNVILSAWLDFGCPQYSGSRLNWKRLVAESERPRVLFKYK